MNVDPVIGTTIRLFMAALFCSAAAHKIVNFQPFVLTLRRYVSGNIPLEKNAVVLGGGIVAIEIGIVAACLMPTWRVPAAMCAALLLLVYALAMLINLRRGNVLLDCGCSWGEGRQPVTVGLVFRNVFLAAASLLVVAPVADRSLAAIDVVSIVVGLGVAGLLYAGINQLVAVNVGLRDAVREVR